MSGLWGESCKWCVWSNSACWEHCSWSRGGRFEQDTRLRRTDIWLQEINMKQADPGQQQLIIMKAGIHSPVGRPCELVKVIKPQLIWCYKSLASVVLFLLLSQRSKRQEWTRFSTEVFKNWRRLFLICNRTCLLQQSGALQTIACRRHIPNCQA